VCDGVVLPDSDRKGQTSFVFCHGFDGDHEVVGGPCHDGGERFVHRSITMNGLAEGDGPIDLFDGRDGSFEFDVLNLFRFWQGRGEACEVSVDL
jgi:hypothetical protein